MVSPAPTSHPLAPTLSEDDAALLTLFVTRGYSLPALAQETSRPLLTLKDWALQPHIQSHINEFKQLESLQHHAETAAARSAGIKELLNVVDTSQDPIERRRAAQTLIRVGMGHPEPRKPKAPAPTEGSPRLFRRASWDSAPAAPQPAPANPETKSETEPAPAPDKPALDTHSPEDSIDAVLDAYRELQEVMTASRRLNQNLDESRNESAVTDSS